MNIPVGIEEILKKLEITSVIVETIPTKTIPDEHGFRQFEPSDIYKITIRGRKKVQNG